MLLIAVVCRHFVLADTGGEILSEGFGRCSKSLVKKAEVGECGLVLELVCGSVWSYNRTSFRAGFSLSLLLPVGLWWSLSSSSWRCWRFWFLRVCWRMRCVVAARTSGVMAWVAICKRSIFLIGSGHVSMFLFRSAKWFGGGPGPCPAR